MIRSLMISSAIVAGSISSMIFFDYLSINLNYLFIFIYYRIIGIYYQIILYKNSKELNNSEII